MLQKENKEKLMDGHTHTQKTDQKKNGCKKQRLRTTYAVCQYNKKKETISMTYIVQPKNRTLNTCFLPIWHVCSHQMKSQLIILQAYCITGTDLLMKAKKRLNRDFQGQPTSHPFRFVVISGAFFADLQQIGMAKL